MSSSTTTASTTTRGPASPTTSTNASSSRSRSSWGRTPAWPWPSTASASSSTPSCRARRFPRRPTRRPRRRALRRRVRVRRQLPETLDQGLERRAGGVHGRRTGGFETGDVTLGDRAADYEQHVVRTRIAERLGGLLREADVGAAEDAQPHDPGVLLHGDGRDRLRALSDPEVDDLEAGIAQRPGDELRAAV